MYVCALVNIGGGEWRPGINNINDYNLLSNSAESVTGHLWPVAIETSPFQFPFIRIPIFSAEVAVTSDFMAHIGLSFFGALSTVVSVVVRPQSALTQHVAWL